MLSLGADDDLEATLHLLRSDASAGRPITILLAASSTNSLEAFVFDGTVQASEVRIVGQPGSEIRLPTAGVTRRRRLQSPSGGNDGDGGQPSSGILFAVHKGAPPIIVINLSLFGRVLVDGGSGLTVTNSSMSGRDLALDESIEPLPALSVHGSDVLLTEIEISDFAYGAINITDGSLRLENGAIRRCGGSSAAMFGALNVEGGSVHLVDFRVEDNGHEVVECVGDKSKCLRGGALRLVSGVTIMEAHTSCKRNLAYEGNSIYVSPLNEGTELAPSLEYRLPTPLGHYVQILNRGLVAKVTTAIIDDPYPFECAGGSYGGSDAREVQSSPRCSGRCPAGFTCPGATAIPLICPRGKYCEAGVSVEADCPGGTFGGREGLNSTSECTPCQAGTWCAAGSKEATPW